MMRFLQVLFTIFFVTPVYAEEVTTWVKYGQNIEYQDFSKIDFAAYGTDEISIPNDLKKIIVEFKKDQDEKVGNKKVFKKLLSDHFKKMNLDSEAIRNMGTKDALELTLKTIPGLALTYLNVDDGNGVPNLAVCLKNGTGDCDKYTGIADEAFYFVKKINPNLKNVYVVDGKTGAKNDNIGTHDWVALAFVDSEKIVVTHVDPTFADNGGEFEADDFHVDTKKPKFLFSFYNSIGDPLALINLITDHSMDLLGSRENMSDVSRLLSQLTKKFPAEKKIAWLEAARQLLKEIEKEKKFDDYEKFDLYVALYVLESANNNVEEKNLYRSKLQTVMNDHPGQIWVNLDFYDKNLR